MKKYEQIEHTADIGIRAYGGDLKELFTNAARGMLEIAFDLDTVEEQNEARLKITGIDTEELLVNWLHELLYLFEVKHLVPKRVHIAELAAGKLTAKVYGQKFDPNHHTVRQEIKAVAYHQLKIEKKDHTYTVQIIFDI